MYNGYANEDEFHKALAEGFQAYAEAYEKGMRERRRSKSLTDREQCFKWGCSNWKLHFRT